MLSKDSSDASWRKSSRSTAQGNECVEVAALAHLIAVRDSKDPWGSALAVPRPAFRRLVEEISQGLHDL